jgi:RPA family protein
MSAGVQRREIARRVFAAEFGLADESIRVGAGERAPTYVISPGGAWMNRVFSVGVLTEQTQVSAGEMIRARIADPSGAIVTYAGQYQPAAAARLEQATVGSMLALTGKARTYQPDDGDAVYTSVRPETVTEVDAQTQGQWIVDTAMATLRRVDLMAALMAASHPTVELQALADADGITDQVLGGVAAIQRYSPGLGFLEQLRVLALEALEVVSGDRDAISDVSLTVGAEASTLGAIPAPARSAVDVEAALATIAAVAGGGQRSRVTAAAADPDDGTSPEPADGQPTTAAGTDLEESTPAPSATDAAQAAAEPDTGVSADADSPTTATVDSQPAETAADVEVSPSDGPTPSSDEEPMQQDSQDAEETPPATADPIADAPPDPSAIEAEVEELGEFELGAETRAELEEEYETDFTTGAELDAAATTQDSTVDTPETTGDTAPETTAAEPVELVIAAMNQLDDGDGAATAAVIDQVVSEADLDRAAVEAAIEEALMGGRCYEPAEGRLTAI